MFRRFAVWFLALSLIMSSNTPVMAQSASSTGKEQSCILEGGPIGACRLFVPYESNLYGFSDVAFILVRTAHFSSESEAQQFTLSLIEPLEHDGVPVSKRSSYAVNEPFFVLEGVSFEGLDASLFIFTEKSIVSLWLIAGSDTDFLISAIEAHLDSIEPSRPTAERALPKANDLPAGYFLVSERSIGLNLMKDPATSENQVVISNRTPSSSSLTSSNSTHAPTDSGAVKILSVTGKDAGIGDGTLYVYVEIENVSGRYVNYIQVDLTCRDDNGGIIATGFANLAGLSPTDRAVLTGIVLQAEGCVRVSAKINPLTD